MSRFQIHEQEGFDEGAQRAIDGEVEAARDSLRAAAPLTDELVHEARKHIKRARALLRLGTLPAEQRRRANELLRDAGRALSPARDRHVVRRMVADLARKNPSDVWLARAVDAIAAGAPEETPLVDQVTATLQDVRERVSEHGSDRSRPRSRGLRRTFGRGREAMRSAGREEHASHFHEWRKRAKDLRYQMEFLSPLWPGVLDAAASELARLTDLLGDANNVGVLILALQEARPDDPPPPDIVAGLEERRARIWRQALAAGERIYGVKPKRFAAQMKACWRAGRD